MQDVRIYSLEASNQEGSFLSDAQWGFFHTGVHFHENQRLAGRVTAEARGGSLSEKHCVGKACDCVCVRFK